MMPLRCFLASEEVKDEPAKNTQAVKPHDNRAPAVQGTESLERNVCKGPVNEQTFVPKIVSSARKWGNFFGSKVFLKNSRENT